MSPCALFSCRNAEVSNQGRGYVCQQTNGRKIWIWDCLYLRYSSTASWRPASGGNDGCVSNIDERPHRDVLEVGGGEECPGSGNQQDDHRGRRNLVMNSKLGLFLA
jgi:hypothetical protein